jgi:tetratricopeptide (TPR) repeat protein
MHFGWPILQYSDREQRRNVKRKSPQPQAKGIFNMKRFTLALATLLFLLSLNAPVFAKDNWLSLRSKNFLLIGNTNEKQIRQVGMRLEQFREVFAQLFPKAVHSTPVPTTVVVFKSENSYRPFKPNANVAGYFQAGPDVNYITLTTELSGAQDPFTVIFHEYTHLLINNTTPNVPLWFNEGLAEYYSTFKMSDDTKVVLGSPISSHVFVLRENKMLPLRTLFEVDESSAYYNERDKQSIFYAESWALMHYLILGKDGQRVPQMTDFLKLMSSGVPLEQAFQRAFAMSFESMEKELREYIKHDRYPVLNGQLKSKLLVEADLRATSMTEAEAQAYMGDLLLHSNRADGETYLKRALALDPNVAMANTSVAMLLLRQGKVVEAREQLKRAAANSSNYLIHYYYAYALSRQADGNGDEIVSSFVPETAAIMRSELKKAIELRPDFVESYSLLAFVNLVTGADIDESIEMLKRVLTTAPGRNDVRLMLAQLYFKKPDYRAARPLLEQLSGIYKDAVTRQRAQFLLDQLKASEEAIVRVRAASSSRTPLVVDQTGNAPINNDPSSYLRQALRKPAAGETQVQGTLERIDCDAKGVVFNIRINDRVLKLRAANFDSVDLTSFNPSAGNAISCGPRKAECNVVVCYLPFSDSRTRVDGTLRSIEFVPRDFQVKAGG